MSAVRWLAERLRQFLNAQLTGNDVIEGIRARGGKEFHMEYIDADHIRLTPMRPSPPPAEAPRGRTEDV